MTFFVVYDNESNYHSHESTSTTEINQNTEITTDIVNTTIFTSSESTTTESSTESSTEAPVMLIDNVKLFERYHWDANSPSDYIKELKLPIKRIIIAHTATNTCEFEEDCKDIVKSVQVKNADLKDIPFNFLIGGDGNVFTGRGFNFEGEHSAIVNTTSYNNIGICVAFIGNFSSSELSINQIKAFEIFIKYFVEDGKIDKNYELFLQDQLVKVKVSADALYEIVKSWKNFHEGTKKH